MTEVTATELQNKTGAIIDQALQFMAVRDIKETIESYFAMVGGMTSMDSIDSISRNTNAGGDFYLLLGDFLDAFYKAPSGVQAQMLSQPPEDMNRQEYVPFLASTAHKLSNDCGLKSPRWVFDRRCYLSGKTPYFACNAKEKLRLLFMYKSPPEFKHRNLFVDENVLTRV
jgi:hypothetical protein